MQNKSLKAGARAALALGLLGLFVAEPAAAQMGPGGPPPVTVAKPVVRDIVEMDEFTGRFEASAAVDIRARVNGYLEIVAFKDGALVKEGDLLFVIDKRPYQAALNQVQASLNAGLTRLELTKSEYERFERLGRSGTAADLTVVQKRQAFLSAQAEVQALRAAVETARLSLSFTEIKAPMAGRISRRLVSEGNLVRENETLLTTIVAVDPVYFYFDIDEKSFLAYQRMAQQGGRSSNGNGLDVLVALADEKEFSRKGLLNFTDNRLDAATGTMRVRAVFENKDQFLMPGLFGRIAVPGSPSYRGILIPDEAIVTDLDRRLVYVVAEDGSVSLKPIRPGARQDGYRIVRDGLKGDETIIVGGLQRVRFGGGKVAPQMTTLPPTKNGNGAAAPKTQ